MAVSRNLAGLPGAPVIVRKSQGFGQFHQTPDVLLDWVTLTLANGWAQSGSVVNQVLRWGPFAVLRLGLDASSATAVTFVTAMATNYRPNKNIFLPISCSSITFTTSPLSVPYLTIGATGTLNITNYSVANADLYGEFVYWVGEEYPES